MIRIDYLKKYPEYVETIVEWVYGEWWSTRYSFDEVVKIYKTLLNDQKLPIALIAFMDEKPAGTALICDYDPDIKLDLTPWLEGLYVKDIFRKCGIGKALTIKIEEIAEIMGYKYLYLSSHLENYYEKMNYAESMCLENGDKLFKKMLFVK